MRASRIAMVLCLFVAGPAVAQILSEKPAVCADPDLKGSLAAWTNPARTAKATQDATGANAAPIAVGWPTHLTLVKSDSVHFVAPTRKDMPKDFIYGGLASFDVPKDGTYRVAAVEGPWMDVIQNGSVATSVSFGKGFNCEGKHVDFPLKAGRVLLQMVGSPDAAIDVLIVPIDVLLVPLP